MLPPKIETTHFKTAFIGNGVDHMNFNFIELLSEQHNVGDEIAVYDGTNCVGAVKLQEHNLTNHVVFIPASSIDKDGMPGFTEGNNYTIRFWKQETNQEFEFNPEIVKGSNTFAKNESVLLSLKNSVLTGINGITENNFPEVKCYPNPFSDEITIEINLIEDSEVNVEVLNQTGQKVKDLISKQQLTGGIQKLNWDGTNASGQKVIHGIYHLRINVDNVILHRKIVFLEYIK